MARVKHKPLPMASQADKDYFWSNVEIGMPWECWEWKSTTYLKGYGKFFFPGRAKALGDFKAHRVAYYLHTGKDPGDLQVCHDCPEGDNTQCCNPEHLFLGTAMDNQHDKIRKGRARYHTGKQLNPHHNHAKGERHGNAIMTAENVREIRTKRSNGERIVSLSREYKVSTGCIEDIVQRRSWRHVT